jgi:hypothetical protein
MDNDLLFPRAQGEADFDFYTYNPSNVAGYIFVSLFAIGTFIHLGYIWPYRSWFFIPFTLGCAGKSFVPNIPTYPLLHHHHNFNTPLPAETGGYYGRAWAHNNIRLGSPYLLQLFLLIGATPLISASIYMTLSRLVKALDAGHHSLVRISWVSKIYILIDIACLVLQVMGTVTQAYGGAEKQDTAINLVVGGLAFQLVAFVFFMILAWVVHHRLAKNGTDVSCRPDIRWKQHFWVLYAASMLVLVRNLVRIVEYKEGAGGAILGSEAYLYVFDAVPMFAVVLLYTFVYPGRMIKQTKGPMKGHGDGLEMPLI